MKPCLVYHRALTQNIKCDPKWSKSHISQNQTNTTTGLLVTHTHTYILWLAHCTIKRTQVSVLYHCTVCYIVSWDSLIVQSGPECVPLYRLVQVDSPILPSRRAQFQVSILYYCTVFVQVGYPGMSKLATIPFHFVDWMLCGYLRGCQYCLSAL